MVLSGFINLRLRLRRHRSSSSRRTHLLPQLLRDGVDVDAEILAQEAADVRVLHVSADGVGAGAAGAVDVDVDSGVAVGAPADLRADRDHLGEYGLREFRVRGDGCDFLVCGIQYAEAGDDEFFADIVL